MKVPNLYRKAIKMKWTTEMKNMLMNAVAIRKAYISTRDLTMEQKFQLVKEDLLEKDEFKIHGESFSDLRPSSVQEKYRKLSEEVFKKFELLISKHGANASGVKEPTEYEKLILDMLKEKAAKDADKKVVTEKRKEVSSVLNSINSPSESEHGNMSSSSQFSSMNRSFANINENTPNDDDTSVEILKKSKTSGEFNALDYIDQLASKICAGLAQPSSKARTELEKATLSKIKKEEEMLEAQRKYYVAMTANLGSK